MELKHLFSNVYKNHSKKSKETKRKEMKHFSAKFYRNFYICKK